MRKFVQKINKNINQSIQIIEAEENYILHKLKEIILLIQAELCNLKDFIAKYKFKNDNEEIFFFKELKPQIASNLIYYAEVFKIESKKSFCSDESLDEFLIEKIKNINHFFNANIRFYQYYKLKSTFQDDNYFLRNKESLFFNLEGIHLFSDLTFTTSHDYLTAKIIAYNKLKKYLNSELVKQKKLNANFNFQNTNFYWTDSKSSLIELIYALHESHSINHGNCDLKEIISFFETGFNVELKNASRTYIEIKQRSIPTKYLDHLKESLIRKIQTEDN